MAAKLAQLKLVDLAIDVKPEPTREVDTKSAKQVFLEENIAKKLLLAKEKMLEKKVELGHLLFCSS